MRQVRQSRYHQIADELRTRIGRGEFGNAGMLPSEADLCGEYAVSRVTVRRALEMLREESLVTSHQGRGWNVDSDPLRQSLGRLGTIESDLAAAGRVSTRRVLSFGFEAAPPEVAASFEGHRSLHVRRLNLADDEPFALVDVWCDAGLAKGLSLADVEGASFLTLLPVRFGGARQTIGAGLASVEEADLLQVPAGSAVLRCRRTTFDVEGRSVLWSEFVFPARHLEFEVALEGGMMSGSIGPSGLRWTKKEAGSD